MADVSICEIGDDRLAEFVKLPFRLYSGDPYWVAPLIGEQLKLLRGGSHFLSSTKHAFLMAYKGGHACGRILVGRYEGMRKDADGKAYFSMPAADDEGTLGRLIDAAEGWARAEGLKGMIGPWSPTDSDDEKGLLVAGFTGPPSLMGSYNKPWYKEVFEKKGYGKLVDFISYSLDRYPGGGPRIEHLIGLAEKRAKISITGLNRRDLERDLRDIHKVMLAAVGGNPDLPSPTWEQFKPEADRLAKLADDRLVLIARRADNAEPVAFVAALPNWSEILKRIGGRLFPFGWIHAIGARKKIRGVRVLLQFCDPGYQGSGVLLMLYSRLRERVSEGGYEYWEAGTVRDDNIRSLKPIIDVGGRLFRVYRWYVKELPQ